MNESLLDSSAPSILILFAHPNSDHSRVHKTLIRAVRDMPEVTIVDLYQEYPDFLIDVEREQARSAKHQLIIFQHPIFWYSCPPLLKEWMDTVLEKGWAYGDDGDAMKGMDFFQVLSTGGPDSAYLRSGYNRFTLHELLRPFEATAVLCGWNYHEPFLVQGVNALDDQKLHEFAVEYRGLLEAYIKEGPSVLNRLDTSNHN